MTQTQARARAQRNLARHLSGSGLELGPGHAPYPEDYVGRTTRYVDRWEPEENRKLFPELGDAAAFGKPDIVCNLDVDKLSSVPDASQDFVIASHVLEHLAEPLGMLTHIERVLKPGGHLLILLPDRRRTFDHQRAPTSFEHLLAEYHQGITDVDDTHIEDFLSGTGVDVDAMEDVAARSAFFDLHRRRSIHVHCWDESEWAETVAQCITELNHAWLLVDVLNNYDVLGSIEFGLVLRKDSTSLPTATRRARFDQVLLDLGPSSVPSSAQAARATEEGHSRPSSSGTSAHPSVTCERCSSVETALDEARADADAWRTIAVARGEKLAVLAESPVGRVLKAAWAVRQRLRR